MSTTYLLNEPRAYVKATRPATTGLAAFVKAHGLDPNDVVADDNYEVEFPYRDRIDGATLTVTMRHRDENGKLLWGDRWDGETSRYRMPLQADPTDYGLNFVLLS